MRVPRHSHALLHFAAVVGLTAISSPVAAAADSDQIDTTPVIAPPVATAPGANQVATTPAVSPPPATAPDANQVATTPAVSPPPVTAPDANQVATTPAVSPPPATVVNSNQVATTFAANGSSPKKLSFILNVPVVYVLHGGVNFDGHQGYLVGAERVAHLPKLSGGFGIRPGVGVFVNHVFPAVSVMALVNFEWSRHGAKSYNAGGVAYEHDDATLINSALELRALLDVMSIKPFVALVPGYGWLKLPAGLTAVDPSTRNTTWSDITLHGSTFAFAFGATYPITDWLLVEGALGCRYHSYTTSSVTPLSGFGMSPGLNAALGMTLRL